MSCPFSLENVKFRETAHIAFDYRFPEPFELKTRLEDVLEEEVSDRYFLKDDAVSKFLKANDSDNALFVQFDLPPTHEAAMFLKTWLTIRINTLNGWERELDELRDCIENERDVFNSDFAGFNECYTFPCEGFEELFKENMERKKGEEDALGRGNNELDELTNFEETEDEE